MLVICLIYMTPAVLFWLLTLCAFLLGAASWVIIIGVLASTAATAAGAAIAALVFFMVPR